MFHIKPPNFFINKKLAGNEIININNLGVWANKNQGRKE
jgi:hypothetical protein